jgi:molybdenum cofactor cytidylyltransferase
MFGPVLIPAAGNSVRMGRPKLLLPLGGQTVLERVLAAARQGGIARGIVVVRPGDDDLADVAMRAGADVVRLAVATPDMRATVLAGLDWIDVHLAPAERPGFFLLPADHPVVTPDVFQALRLEIGRQKSSIVVPVHAGRRGHPVWIAWSHVPALRRVPEGLGLNRYIAARAAETIAVPWPTPEVLLDLDTPDDYHRLLTNEVRPLFVTSPFFYDSEVE